MKALIKKNKIIRESYKNLELNYYIKSALYNNNILSLAKKEQLAPSGITLSAPGKQQEQGTPRREAIVGKISRIRNICVLTGRTRAVIQKYKMSRIKFKQNAEAGLLPGIRKL
jgi:ribosomal protein S14